MVIGGRTRIVVLVFDKFMNSGIFQIGIGIVVVSIMIYVIKNFNDIKNIIISQKDKKYYKFIYLLIIILISIYMLYFVYSNIQKMIKNIEKYKWSMNNIKVNEYNDEKIANEFAFYKSVIDKDYENQKPQEPYIPEGFSYVEGEWNSGFVIQDKDENQYVWVPCTNKNEILENVEKLDRKNFSLDPFISKDICINEGSEKFIISSLENGGFYISRFEIGIENNKYVSKSGMKILSNITKKEALNVVNEMKTSEGVNYELINGYAYDTTLAWIKNKNDIKVNKYYNKDNPLTGRNSYNNIYDFTDNVLEMTSETSYESVIIRGFLFEKGTNNETLDDLGYTADSMGRISIRKEDSYYTIDNIMGLRTILYK